MPDDATLSVLRDVVLLGYAAVLLGLVCYAWMRHAFPLSQWNHTGNVAARAYELPDAALAALVLFFLTGGLITGADSPQAATGEKAPGTDLAEASAILVQIVIMLGGTAMVVAYLRIIRGLNPAELFGLHRVRPRAAIAVAAAAVIPTLLVISGVSAVTMHALEGLWPDTAPQEIVQKMLGTSSMPVRALMIFAAVCVAPLTEEVLFRGFIYGVLKRFTDSHFAALISALFFATVHLHVSSFLPLFVLAILLATAYEMTGSLLVPMLMHALFNAIMIAWMFAGGSP